MEHLQPLRGATPDRGEAPVAVRRCNVSNVCEVGREGRTDRNYSENEASPEPAAQTEGKKPFLRPARLRHELWADVGDSETDEPHGVSTSPLRAQSISPKTPPNVETPRVIAEDPCDPFHDMIELFGPLHHTDATTETAALVESPHVTDATTETAAQKQRHSGLITSSTRTAGDVEYTKVSFPKKPEVYLADAELGPRAPVVDLLELVESPHITDATAESAAQKQRHPGLITSSTRTAGDAEYTKVSFAKKLEVYLADAELGPRALVVDTASRFNPTEQCVIASICVCMVQAAAEDILIPKDLFNIPTDTRLSSHAKRYATAIIKEFNDAVTMEQEQIRQILANPRCPRVTLAEPIEVAAKTRQHFLEHSGVAHERKSSMKDLLPFLAQARDHMCFDALRTRCTSFKSLDWWVATVRREISAHPTSNTKKDTRRALSEVGTLAMACVARYWTYDRQEVPAEGEEEEVESSHGDGDTDPDEESDEGAWHEPDEEGEDLE